jgi:hypothetical protein
MGFPMAAAIAIATFVETTMSGDQMTLYTVESDTPQARAMARCLIPFSANAALIWFDFMMLLL